MLFIFKFLTETNDKMSPKNLKDASKELIDDSARGAGILSMRVQFILGR